MATSYSMNSGIMDKEGGPPPPPQHKFRFRERLKMQKCSSLGEVVVGEVVIATKGQEEVVVLADSCG